MTQNIGIIIPSYNEAANIEILTKRIFLYLPEAKIIIVDDSNPKENSSIKKYVRERNPPAGGKKIILISRLKKLGRGSAVIDGLKEMLKNKSINYFFEMDADLAHNPQDFQKFLVSMKSTKADLVIGSRYLEKSKIIKWPLKRLILSKIINTFINIWLGLKLSDYTNGFRLYNRKAVDFLIKAKLKEKGFIALSEIAFKLKKNKFKIAEVPINFTDRKYGKSSAGVGEFAWSLIGIIRIRFNS